MRLVAGEVQDGARDHRVHAAVGMRKPIERGDGKVGRRQLRREPRRRLLHQLNRGGILVHAEAGEAVLQEVDQVPAVAAAGVEHARAGVEPAAKNLIEEIDVDVAELRPQLAAERLWRRHTAADAGRDQSGSGRPNQIHAM